MRGIGINLLLVAGFVLLAWVILEGLGFEMALVSSLGISIVLTLLLNLMFRSRARAHS